MASHPDTGGNSGMDCGLDQVDGLFFFSLTTAPSFPQVPDLPVLLMPSKLPKYFSVLFPVSGSHTGEILNQRTGVFTDWATRGRPFPFAPSLS